jgi:hypothetical protein
MSYIVKGAVVFVLGAIAGGAGMIAYSCYKLLDQFEQAEL